MKRNFIFFLVLSVISGFDFLSRYYLGTPDLGIIGTSVLYGLKGIVGLDIAAVIASVINFVPSCFIIWVVATIVCYIKWKKSEATKTSEGKGS